MARGSIELLIQHAQEKVGVPGWAPYIFSKDMEDLMDVRCMVAGHNASGEPDFFFVIIRLSEGAYEDGYHYERAVSEAEEEGYEPPFVAFDEFDDAGKAMLDKFVWKSASIITYKEECYYIWSREHRAWWAPRENGYTQDISKAGRYTLKQTEGILFRANNATGFEECAMPASVVDKEVRQRQSLHSRSFGSVE